MRGGSNLCLRRSSWNMRLAFVLPTAIAARQGSHLRRVRPRPWMPSVATLARHLTTMRKRCRLQSHRRVWLGVPSRGPATEIHQGIRFVNFPCAKWAAVLGSTATSDWRAEPTMPIGRPMTSPRASPIFRRVASAAAEGGQRCLDGARLDCGFGGLRCNCSRWGAPRRFERTIEQRSSDETLHARWRSVSQCVRRPPEPGKPTSGRARRHFFRGILVNVIREGALERPCRCRSRRRLRIRQRTARSARRSPELRKTKPTRRAGLALRQVGLSRGGDAFRRIATRLLTKRVKAWSMPKVRRK